MYCLEVSIVHCYFLIKHWVLNSFTDISYDKMNQVKAHINLFKLTKLTETDDSTIELCKEFGLFPKEITCPNCNGILDKVYKVKNRSTNIFRFQCNKRDCRKKGKKNTVTLRANTWFNESRLSLRKSLFMTYCFVHQMSYKDTIRETSIEENNKNVITSSETVCDYKRYCRDICYNIVSEMSSDKIGGPGLTVEIDESKFGKNKYHKGRYMEGQWIFGGICRETKDFFVVPVPKRDSLTLIPVILSKIAEGSTIISDCWRSYNVLSELDYTHLTVNHQYNFVDPDTLAHTQNIESLWWQIKRQLPDTNTKHEQLYLHLTEYMWRKSKEPKSDLFLEFLSDATKYVRFILLLTYVLDQI